VKKVLFDFVGCLFLITFAPFNNNLIVFMVLKKMGLLFVLPALVCACSSDEETLPKVAEAGENEVSTFRLSPQEAASAVSDFLSEQPANGVRGAVVKDDREVETVVDLEGARRTRGATALTDSVTKNFYFVTLKGGRGYAVVSKDKRTFPVFAVLDEGAFSPDSLNTEYMQYRLQQAQEGQKSEIAYFDRKWEEYVSGQRKTRSMEKDMVSENTPKVSLSDLVNQGWTKIREAKPKLAHVKWKQKIMPCYNGVVCKNGLPLSLLGDYEEMKKCISFNTNKFGCTTVAYAQVLYALRNYPGFRDLRYTNGERVRWEEMKDSASDKNEECQRFMGWITANCNPHHVGNGTMIFNADAKDFIRKILAGYIEYRYDNCIVGKGDFDGYGWSEDKRVAIDYFTHPEKCFVIMTAGASVSGVLNQFDLRYHTYVIDGMAEFNKRESYRQVFWKKWSTTVRRMYHVNAGWGGFNNGYYLYVDSKRGFEYNGKYDCMNYRSKASYFVMYPKD
jgi:hypothetical protein